MINYEVFDALPETMQYMVAGIHVSLENEPYMVLGVALDSLTWVRASDKETHIHFMRDIDMVFAQWCKVIDKLKVKNKIYT